MSMPHRKFAIPALRVLAGVGNEYMDYKDIVKLIAENNPNAFDKNYVNRNSHVLRDIRDSGLFEQRNHRSSHWRLNDKGLSQAAMLFPDSITSMPHPQVREPKSACVDNPTPLAEEIPIDATLFEGALRQINVNAHERNPIARRLCIDHYGLSCSVCEVDLSDVYGPVADGFIHVHHLTPLSDITAEYKIDPVADMRPVCPNCHAVIHLGDVVRSIEEVRELLNEYRRTKP